ncbi:heterochromatin protein 1-like [Teleopsis dalmanni]|uniref:heterochromatin protein 1-like n=1 Tax=Teleopsis dalmanni TaxID=139649 RepID=UPI0018CD21D8|nr:heterochromatin protein 1-like [Teleopsis dalmanni]
MKTKRTRGTRQKAAPNAVTEEVYVVESICGKRVSNGTIEYQLKWLGFSDGDNTWEPINNLDCKDLIQKYEMQLVSDRASFRQKDTIDGPLSSGDRKRKANIPEATTDILTTKFEHAHSPEFSFKLNFQRITHNMLARS